MTLPQAGALKESSVVTVAERAKRYNQLVTLAHIVRKSATMDVEEWPSG